MPSALGQSACVDDGVLHALIVASCLDAGLHGALHGALPRAFRVEGMPMHFPGYQAFADKDQVSPTVITCRITHNKFMGFPNKEVRTRYLCYIPIKHNHVKGFADNLKALFTTIIICG
jgi:hypothetical protein